MEFSANISTMFREKPFLQRFAAAQQCGFKYVESQFEQYEFDPNELAIAKGNGINYDLMNLNTGNFVDGCLALPSKEFEFISSTNIAISYHRALNFKKLHILCGPRDERFTVEEQKHTAVQNLNSLVENDYFENMGIIGLLEPQYKEKYFLDSFDLAVEILDEVNSPEVKLLLDIYHLYKSCDDLKASLEKYFPYAGHIQISQDPGRVQPFAPGGKIDYNYVFDYLLQKKYNGIIGLEYVPSGKTEESLHWMKNYKKDAK